MKSNLTLLPAQLEFVLSEKRHTGFVAGYGSGKTEGGVTKTIVQKLKHPYANVAYYLPSYPLIKDIAIPRFESILDKIKLQYQTNQTDKVISVYNGGFNFGKIILRSMDNPKYIVGYEVGYSLIDECDILPMPKMKEVFRMILARNRAKLKKDINKVDMVGTPEGFKFFYNFFEKNKSDNKVLIKASTYDNPYLPDGYIDSLLDEYPAHLLEAYLNGEFVNMNTGAVFNDFDKEKHHTDRVIQKSDVLHVGIDFNITKMSAVIHVIDGNKLYAVDEITNAYDTNQLGDIIKEKYKGHRIAVYPDASGNSRKTSASVTDVQILKSKGFVVRVKSKNPFVKDRINETNRRFRDLTYFVNTNKCISYTESLEQLAYDKNGQPDKSSGLDHIIDAGTYCVWWHKPKRFNIR